MEGHHSAKRLSISFQEPRGNEYLYIIAKTTTTTTTATTTTTTTAFAAADATPGYVNRDAAKE